VLLVLLLLIALLADRRPRPITGVPRNFACWRLPDFVFVIVLAFCDYYKGYAKMFCENKLLKHQDTGSREQVVVFENTGFHSWKMPLILKFL